jgi:fructose-1-phosphate kinase PfkB-like protein
MSNDQLDDDFEQLADEVDELLNNEDIVVENGNQPQELWLHPVTTATIENLTERLSKLMAFSID